MQRFARWVIYAHVVALGGTTLFSYLDQQRGLDMLPAYVMGALFLPMVLCLFVCPLLVLGATVSGRLQGREAVVVCLAEIIVECAQWFSLLPAVS